MEGARRMENTYVIQIGNTTGHSRRNCNSPRALCPSVPGMTGYPSHQGKAHLIGGSTGLIQSKTEAKIAPILAISNRLANRQ
jgi:hypothetical protein